MGVERPDGPSISVDVETMGAAAREMVTLKGLTDWAGTEHTDLRAAGEGVFPQGRGITGMQNAALKAAWYEAKKIENLTTRYADALTIATRQYGETDRHSAAAVAAAATGMQPPRDDDGE
ncbi:MAG: hypothetical protein ACRDT6_03075 [Micromonosporaceae bacterium]